MKQDIFNLYVGKVTDLFHISREELFTKTKKKTSVDARHLLYYLCFSRPMRIKYIQDYMEDNGYKISHSSVIYGINTIESKMGSDEDYVDVIEKLKG
jgi:chromosomal replication initiation ATPase DnaA